MKLSIKKVSSLLLITSLLFTACEGPSSVSSPSQLSSVQQQSSPAAQPGVPQQSSPTAQPASGNLLLDEAVDYLPLVAGHYVFWHKAYDSATISSNLTYGYDLQAHQSFVVKQAGSSAAFLQSDGVDLVWRVAPTSTDIAAAFHSPVQSIALDSVQAGSAPTKLTTALSEHGTILLEAYDQGILYYRKPEPGVYSYNLNTGAENMVTAHADRLVVHKGVLLWQDSLGHGYREGLTARLHLQTSQTKDIIIAQDDAHSFNNFSVDGNNVVWSSDRGTYLYDISKQTTTRLTVDQSGETVIGRTEWVNSEGAVIAGDHIAWVAVTQTVSTDSPSPPQWSVQSYDLKSGQSRVVVAASTTHLYVDGLTAQGDLVYGVENRKTGQRGLYLTSVSSSNAGYDTVVRADNLVPNYPTAAEYRGTR